MRLTIGENIRTERKAMGLTQEQLAEAMGVTVGAVSKWESGMSNPDIGMLPVLAEFFAISVDALLGYHLHGKSMAQMLENMKSMQLEKRYEEGVSEAEKALQKYPNHFDVVYQSAWLYHTKGCEQNDRAALKRALELYNRACALIKQNTDETISELLIQKCIGQIYISLNMWDQAVTHLKKYNFCGVNNCDIGIILALTETYEQAFGYLSDSLLDSVMELFRTAVGLANCYFGEEDRQAGMELFLWMHSVIGGLRSSAEVSYLDKMDAVLLYGCAQASLEDGRMEAAQMYLRRAKDAAERFDESPDFSPYKIKFYHGKKLSLSDDFGETAMLGIERHLMMNSGKNPALLKFWAELNQNREALK